MPLPSGDFSSQGSPDPASRNQSILFKCSYHLLTPVDFTPNMLDFLLFVFLYFSENQFALASQSEKAMAPHSSTLAWKIPWAEEPGGLQSMGSQRVRHNWVTPLSLFTFMHWRRKWQPTPVFLPGEFQGWGSLVGCHLWGHRESNMTEAT